MKYDLENGAASPYWIFVIFLVTIFVVMFVYIIMSGTVHDFVVMGKVNGADSATGDMITQGWDVYFIVAGVFALLVEAIIAVQRV